jgi:hypothetical protein
MRAGLAYDTDRRRSVRTSGASGPVAVQGELRPPGREKLSTSAVLAAWQARYGIGWNVIWGRR